MSVMPEEHFVIEHRVPTAHEYMRLREVSGCEHIGEQAVVRALGNSLFAVCAVLGDKVIGCGRVVGDGGLYFFIEALMLEPGYEGQGIEECLMDEIMEYLKSTAPPSAFFCIKGCRLQQEQCRQYGFMPQD